MGDLLKFIGVTICVVVAFVPAVYLVGYLAALVVVVVGALAGAVVR